MMKYIVIFVTAITLFISCKKDTITNPIVNPEANINASFDLMMPIAVGNYWIYKRAVEDSLGNPVYSNQSDSVYISKDSLILGEHYFKFSHTNITFDYYYHFNSSKSFIWMKDSTGYLINYPCQLLLDTVDILDSLQTDVIGFNPYCKLVPDTFLNRNFYLGNYSGYWMRKCFIFPIVNNQFNGTYCYQAFVKHIGLIKARMLFTTNPYHTMYSYNLIRYHVN